jgi:hypothetical protein
MKATAKRMTPWHNPSELEIRHSFVFCNYTLYIYIIHSQYYYQPQIESISVQLPSPNGLKIACEKHEIYQCYWSELVPCILPFLHRFASSKLVSIHWLLYQQIA